MDKNKSRTDLLAAGRKKLQQFRQKKDNKGSNSKSSGKSGKSGRDTQPHAVDGERSKHDVENSVAISQSDDMVDSVATEIAVTSDEFSAKAGISEAASRAAVPGFLSESSGVDHTKLNQSNDGPDVDSGISLDGRSSTLVLEDAEDSMPSNTGPTNLSESSLDSSTLFPIDFSSDQQDGGEQVTDVGAMQDVGQSSGNQVDKSTVKQFEGDGSLPSSGFSGTVGENAITDPGNAPDKEEINVAAQPINTDCMLLTGDSTNDPREMQKSHDLSVVNETSTEMFPIESSEVNGQQREWRSSGSSNVNKTEVLHTSGSSVNFHTEGIQANTEFADAEGIDFNKSLGCKKVDLSSVLDGSMIKLSQLAEILRVLDEDEFRFLCMSKKSPLEKYGDADEIKIHEPFVHDAFERLKEQLYVTSFSKDAMQLQLCEQQKLVDKICAVNTSLIEVQGRNEIFAEEVTRCRNELQEVVLEREELREQLHLSKADVEDLAAKVNDLQNKLDMAHGEISNLSSELLGCQNLVESLQTENANLNGSSKRTIEEKEKISEENRVILLENEKLSEELAQSKASVESLQSLLRDDARRLEEKNDSVVDENRTLLANVAECKSAIEALEEKNKNLNEILTSLSEERKWLEEEKERTFSEYEKQSHDLKGLQAECSTAVDDLKEATIRIDQLSRENDVLNADLEFYKCKLNYPDQKKSQFATVENQAVENVMCSLPKREADWPSLEQLKLNVYDDAGGFLAIKRNLGNAEVMMRELENEIEGMHLHSVSLSKAANKVASPKVSRLIQAFETKNNVDDQEPEKPPSSENHTTEDLYLRTKMVTSNLRVLLEELVSDAENASEFCRVMQIKLGSDSANSSGIKYTSLREHTDLVEEANIELMILYEVMRLHSSDAVVKENELLNLSSALQKQEVALKSENSQLREKLTELEIKIGELHSQLDGICRDADEKVDSVFNKLQTLQAEVAHRESILEEEWKSAFTQVLNTVGELDSTFESTANSFATGDSDVDIVGRVAASVCGACKMIEDMREQLAAAHSDRQEILDRSNMALSILHKMYNEISELVITFGHNDDRAQNFVADNMLDLLHSDVSSILLDRLKELLGERLQLESDNQQLNAELMTRSSEIDELDKRCLKSDTIIKLVEEIEHSLMLGVTETDTDEPVSRLQSLILLLVQKYKEADQCLNLSKSLEMQLSGLQGQVDHLYVLHVQYENENLVLKDSLKSAEEDIVALGTKLKEKVSELEQSEQRVLSLREKLSIAVTKGKGLISQRDSLKQSLAETSKELEKCSQELQSKDARLHELESKLRVYSEAGERMEALESELSYIRNSATALRESFLLKDSVLQRIEEILEDIELPEHFHSRNTIEKVEWLAKSIGGNSLPLGDWDQRNSVGGGSYSDTGFVGVEGLKDEMQPNSDSSDDLRRRYEELENKFYGLAEQNEMLEQSLMDMNNLVQRWEGILNGVDMPSQLRSMEPEDKILWLETALSEAQNHCYSLQQKIDNLETICGSLTADVEDSQRRASELVSAFQLACVEKEIISLKLEILSHENEEISKKNAMLETTNGSLQYELRLFQEEKLWAEEDTRHTNEAIRKLNILVCDALQDYGAEDRILSQQGVVYLEEVSRKLVEKYRALSSGNPVSIDSVNVHATEEGQMSHTSRGFDENDVATLRKQLEDSAADYMMLKEERDEYMLKNQSLHHAVEELEMKRKELHELLNQEELKSASFSESLSKKLEDSTSELQILKEEKDRYETNNQALLHEIEELDMKRTELQELLNQEERRSATLRDTLNKELEDCMGELTLLKEEKDGYVVKNQSLLNEVEELEMKKNELQELLHQEELKSASLQELLNQEEQKSVSLRETLSRKLEDGKGELAILKEEKDGYMMNNQTLLHEVEELGMEKKELQELLYQEELKSATLTETLSKKLQDSMSELMTLKEEKERLLLSNQSLLHEVEELEMKRKELQELHKQEEMKSVSLAETLKDVQDSGSKLMILDSENNRLVQNNQSLLSAVEGLEMKKKELQELLKQEEQKSNSLREKLNVAVRKGKSLVQQRDSMKQVIEELNAEIERLKSETKDTAKAVSEQEEQTKNLLSAQERIHVLESEKAVLRDRLEETECRLQEKEDGWNQIVHALENIDLGHEFNSRNPDERMKEIGNYLTDLHTRIDSLGQESRKSKRAAELLLAELNEVQERNDGLQEELAKADHELSELSREKDLAEKAKCEAFAQIEELSYTHSEEKDRQLSEIMALRSNVDSMREDLSAIERELGDVLSKDFEVLQNLKAVLKSLLESGGSTDFESLVPGSFPHRVVPRKAETKVVMAEIDSLRKLLYNHSHLLQDEASQLSEVVMNVHRGYAFHKETWESMKKDVQNLELIEKEKESELHILRRDTSLLYETCANVISEIENWKDHVAGNASLRSPEKRKSQIPIEGWNSSANDIPIVNEEGIRNIRDKLLLVVRDFMHMQNDLVEGGQSEMKHTILNLQKELQEKDIQRERVCMELVNQIKEAETNAKNYSHELQQVRIQMHNAQSQLNAMEEEHKALEQTIKELRDQETDSKDLQEKVNSLTEALAAKTQETEALMQALDAEEAEMEDLTNKVANMENELQQKNKDLENTETSRAKALKKLSVTVSKFDELHYFSESLLSEVEKLQSQLQEQDTEISFLRQEVTRCTNDALMITEHNKRSVDEIHDLVSWLDSLTSTAQMQDVSSDNSKSQLVNESKEALQKKILNLISELENLRMEAQKSDILLQKERSKVEDLTQKEQHLKNSLHEKESQLVKFQEAGNSSKSMKSPSEIVEVEPMSNKWTSSGTVASQVRSLRKTNNDQVAIAIDVDQRNDQLEDDDDKAHGFKSLTTSKFVPRFTRPVSDLVDGLWVSCDRALMRQPALRLGLILYWAVLHALLAAFVV